MRKKKPSLTFQHPAKILIIRLSSIGDIILTTPLLRQLRAKFPATQIDFLVRREYAELLRSNPHLSNILEIDVHQKGSLRTMKRKIRRANYTAVLDLHRNFRSVWLTRFYGHPQVFKIQKNRFLRHLLVNYKINLYPKFYKKPLSVAEKYLRAAAPFNLDLHDTRLELFLPAEIQNRTRKQWPALSEQGFLAIIAPGARHFTKRWLPEYYVTIIRKIHDQLGWKTVLVGGPEEIKTCVEIQQHAGTHLTKNLAGQLTLSETLGFIQNARLFISNDSGLMHAAAAFQVPQIAIFGSTTRELGFFPLNPRAVIAENKGLPCRPCSHIGKAACPKKHFKCMCDVTPETVCKAINSLELNG